MKKVLSVAGAAALAAALAIPQSARAACDIPAGSVRILANDFAALRIIIDAAQTCASNTVSVTANETTQHDSLQVPALQISPAAYSAVFVANNSLFPLMDKGLIRPLDDLVAKYGADLRPEQLVTVDGHVMAIAVDINAQHLFYRADILRRAGIAPPTTYEGILAAAKIIREKGLMQYPLAATDQAGWYVAAEFVNMYLGYGGAFFKPGTAEPSIDNSRGIAALNMMKALAAYMAPDYTTYSADEMNKVYMSGKVAMMNQWGSVADTVIDRHGAAPEIAANTVLAAAPTVDGGSTPAAALWWDGFVIARNVSDEDAKASFLALLHGIRTEVARAHPDDATWLADGYRPGLGSAGVLATAHLRAQPYPMVPYMDLLHAALGSELPQFLLGREDAATALANVESAYIASARASGFLR
ncbi:ABC transporter substrate-binding protein [Paraburkholderia sp. J12]|uniref:ABC transporter substrate-binding protein n=1 Tax=Paraburkholderia sp. J12 TaxID=2805432 RepID=UPI002ABDB93F|nr:extracellular solute-binding protein [Paraburkholderia sp. J12]